MGRCPQLGRTGSPVVSRWLSSSEVSKASYPVCISLYNAVFVNNSWFDLKLGPDGEPGHLALLQDRRTLDHEGQIYPRDGIAELKDFLSIADQDFQEDTKGSSDSRCLHEMLEESQSDSPVSFYSHLDSSEESDNEV